MRFSIPIIVGVSGLLGSVSGAAVPKSSLLPRDQGAGVTKLLVNTPLGPSVCKGKNDIVPKKGGWHAASLAPRHWNETWSCGACVEMTAMHPTSGEQRKAKVKVRKS